MMQVEKPAAKTLLRSLTLSSDSDLTPIEDQPAEKPVKRRRQSRKPVDVVVAVTSIEFNCSACLGRDPGLKCFTCPARFHHNCLPFVTTAQPFYCLECTFDQEPLRDNILQPLLSLKINPRAFRLPSALRNQFENVATHPATGAYIDMDAVEVTTFKNERKRERVDEYERFCWKCNISAEDGIRCSICEKKWHKQCISEEIGENIEICDLKSITEMKDKLWNGPLDEKRYDISALVGNKTKIGARELHMIDRAKSGSNILRTLVIKRHWICPLHHRREKRIKWRNLVFKVKYGKEQEGEQLVKRKESEIKSEFWNKICKEELDAAVALNRLIEIELCGGNHTQQS